MNKSTDYDKTLYRLQINLTDYELFHYTPSVYEHFHQIIWIMKTFVMNLLIIPFLH